MIKVWCGACKGKGIIERRGHYMHECACCNGKGYTEHEGSLEDLELAAAIRWVEDKMIWFETFDELVTLYKEQKGSNHA